jgi:ADP-heptose:LPS heptosyltransferase
MTNIDKKVIDIKKFRNILIPRLDTFGDIVLLQGFIQALLDFLPEARITILVRQGYEQLASVFPNRLIWKTTRIHPYKEPPDIPAIKLLSYELRQESYDLLLTTTYNRAWSDELIAAVLISTHRVALGDANDDHEILTKILPELGAVMPEHLYDQYIPVEEKIHETEKYQLFWNKITSEKKNIPPPQLVIPEIESTRAGDVLTRAGLKKGKFVFCFPAGVSNVSLKTWPEENFAQVVAHLEKKYSLRTLIAAHESEKEIVDKVVDLARKKGANPEIWLGKDGDVPLACALAAQSYFYLGNDTGMMHMAAALGKPIIAIFGGGTWPRFLPCTNVGRIFVTLLPCFYCRWNCIFNEPFCINFVSADAVKNEIEAMLNDLNRGTEVFKVVECVPDPERLYKVLENIFEQIDKLTGLLKKSEADRVSRLGQIDELTRMLKESEADRAARLEQIMELTNVLKESEADRAARLEVIHGLEEKINQIQNELVQEKKRADDSEQGWRELESAFAVRQARRIGLIKARKFASREFTNED